MLLPSLLLSQGGAAHPHRSGGDAVGASPKAFVESFYRWYCSLTESPARELPTLTAIRRKGSMFSPTLRKALLIDSLASIDPKAGGEVGLDFDPFLNGQDPPKKYVVRKVTLGKPLCSVAVEGVRDPEANNGTRLIVQLERSGSSWKFVNFLYPERHDNLVHILKLLREERASWTRPTKKRLRS